VRPAAKREPDFANEIRTELLSAEAVEFVVPGVRREAGVRQAQAYGRIRAGHPSVALRHARTIFVHFAEGEPCKDLTQLSMGTPEPLRALRGPAGNTVAMGEIFSPWKAIFYFL
jgi:hypothetical protein